MEAVCGEVENTAREVLITSQKQYGGNNYRFAVRVMIWGVAEAEKYAYFCLRNACMGYVPSRRGHVAGRLTRVA